jgi:PAS domain S-box-containing protein
MKSKKIYILLSILLLLLGYMFHSVYDEVKNKTIAEFNTQQLLLAKQAAKGIEKQFEHFSHDLNYLSEITHIISFNEQGKALFQSYYTTHDDVIQAITRVNEHGHITYTFPFNQKAIGTDISYQNHVKSVIETQKPVVSDVFTAVQGFQAVAFHQPVFEDNIFKGSLALLIPFHRLAKEYLGSIKIGEEGYAWVISQKGVELFCPVPGHVGKTVAETSGRFPSVIAMAEEMMKGNTGATTYTYDKIRGKDIEQVTKHAVYYPINLGNTLWSIVVATPESQVLAAMSGFRNKLAFFLFLIIIVASILSYYIVRAITVIREEERRRQAEKALLNSEKKYRTILDDIEDGYFEVDIKGNLTFFNDSLCKILGYPRSELMGMNNREFMDDENSKKVFQTFNQVFSTEEPLKGFDWEVIQKDGSRRYLDTSVSLIKDDKEQKIGFRGITRDISERKRTEEKMRENQNRYQALFERSLDCVFIHDFKGNLIDANDAALKMLGYNRKDLSSLKIKSFVSSDQFAATEKILKELMETGQQKNISAFRLRHKDGHYVDVETISSVIHKNGKPYAIQGIARDITAKVKMEERFRQAQKMEAIGTLAGGIAHDFNNILSAIIGYTEMAQYTLPEDNPAMQHLSQVYKASTRAKDLVMQILTFSRQAGQDLKPLKSQVVIKEALKLLRASIPSTIEIRQSIDNSCGSILADPTQIHQIIMNLCTNAYHAMRETGGILGVSLSQEEYKPHRHEQALDLKPGHYVKLQVSDTGSGIDEKLISRIFEPYYTTKPKGEGTGMGLAVVHGIVKSYGGDISVSSKMGNGTMFSVYFPIVESESDPVQKGIESPLPSGHENILVVDDEIVLAEITGKMLENLGYKVKVFTNSEEAFATFQANPEDCDLIISDMTMPKLNGLQLAEKLIKIKPNIPIIICTGFSDLISEEKIKALGIKEVVMKPISIKDLARAARNALDG